MNLRDCDAAQTRNLIAGLQRLEIKDITLDYLKRNAGKDIKREEIVYHAKLVTGITEIHELGGAINSALNALERDGLAIHSHHGHWKCK